MRLQCVHPGSPVRVCYRGVGGGARFERSAHPAISHADEDQKPVEEVPQGPRRKIGVCPHFLACKAMKLRMLTSNWVRFVIWRLASFSAGLRTPDVARLFPGT